MAKKKRPVRQKKTEEEINQENEFLKLKMMAQYGGNFMESEGVPAEVENHFLKQILNFQKKHENAGVITIYDYIGQPDYDHVRDLSDKEVKRALRKIIALMEKHHIKLDVLAPTPEREIYRFVVEELFKQQIENIRLKGWSHHFIYEEFHPNTEYDIRSTLHMALLSLFDKLSGFYENYFSENMKDRLGLSTDPEDLKEKVNTFQELFHDVQMVHYDILDLRINEKEKTAVARCQAVCKLQKTKGKRSRREVITAELHLKQVEEDGNLWEVERVLCDKF